MEEALLGSETPAMMSSDGLPLEAMDIARWAGLRRTKLDKASFIKHWRQYLTSVAHVVEEEGGGPRARDLAHQGHLFARKVIRWFEDFDFLLSANEDQGGALVLVLHDEHTPLKPILLFLADGVCAMPDRPCANRTRLNPNGYKNSSYRSAPACTWISREVT
jgi:hypothetical protein